MPPPLVKTVCLRHHAKQQVPPSLPQAEGMNPFADDVCAGPFGMEENRSVPGLNVDILGQLTATIDERQSSTGRAGGQPLLLTCRSYRASSMPCAPIQRLAEPSAPMHLPRYTILTRLLHQHRIHAHNSRAWTPRN